MGTRQKSADRLINDINLMIKLYNIDKRTYYEKVAHSISFTRRR